jgi:hypothetical protein
MQRTGLWQQVQDQVREVLDGLRATDDVALYTFDSDVRAVIPFSDGSEAGEVPRASVILAGLADLAPGNAATDLGRALTTAADVLHTSRDSEDSQSPLPKQIVVVTDLQEGSDLEGLRSYTWPHEVHLEVRSVVTPGPTNARAVVFADDRTPSGAEEAPADRRWRVTVYNAADSVDQQFHLGWADRSGGLVGTQERTVQVPPGGSRTLRLMAPPAGVEQLLLTGDEQAFDNSAYIARPTQQKMEVLFVGADHPEVKESPLYYLTRADFDDARRDVSVKPLAGEPLPSAIVPAEVPLVVAAEPVTIADEEVLREYIQAGGGLLMVLTQGFVGDDAVQTLGRLIPGERLRIVEAEVDDYAMLAEIDFSHAIFQPFADPRFNDFTKIHFWSHRHIELGEETSARVLARFDDRSPALVEFPLEKGTIWVLAAGWQPAESQLALSSKFVPLLAAMLKSPAASQLKSTYSVGERLVFPEGHSFQHLIAPNGEIHDLTSARVQASAASGLRRGSGSQAVVFDRPGVYRLADGRQEHAIAVNLALAESRTAPLDVSELEALGVQMGQAATAAELEAERRRLRDFELERTQKLWQWLLVGALAVLCLESWLAGRLSRRPVTAAPVPILR